MKARAFKTTDRNALRDMVVNFGIVTRFNGELPDALTNRQYRLVIEDLADVDNGGVSQFDKQALQQIAEAVGVALDGRESTRDLRKAIARRCDFEYDSPSQQIRTFNKPELKRIALELAERDFKENGGTRFCS